MVYLSLPVLNSMVDLSMAMLIITDVITRGYGEAWDDPPRIHDPMIPGFSHRPIMKMSTLDEFQPLAGLIHWEATIYLSIRE